jgi:SAM-dependent methyltransferase
MLASAAFDSALRGSPSRLRSTDGTEIALDVARWSRDADGDDAWLLDRCAGPSIDLGCGPGRLVAALAARGLESLGVDHSRAAARQCRRRGADMVLRDVFGTLPGECGWAHVLLADGNIGIGGDPARLLARAADLLGPGGTLLVEVDPQPDRLWRGVVRVCTDGGVGEPLPWACAGADALTAIGRVLGLHRRASHTGARSFVEFVQSARAA